MRIRSVVYDNRKKVFELGTSTKILVFPFSKADPVPTMRDPITKLFVDPETELRRRGGRANEDGVSLELCLFLCLSFARLPSASRPA